jgi:putative flippase GtrA
MPTGEIRGQAIRYVVSGGILMLLYSAVYWTLAAPLAVPALIANTIAFLVSLVVGWMLHSRWSFRGHGRRDQKRVAYTRFFLLNIAGYALNSFWVWLIVEQLQGSVALPLLPIAFVTPWLGFWLSRRWVFAPPKQ